MVTLLPELTLAKEAFVLSKYSETKYIRGLQKALSSLQGISPKHWRAVLSQLYSGQPRSQRLFDSNTELLYNFLGSLGASKASVYNLCKKASPMHCAIGKTCSRRCAGACFLHCSSMQDLSLPTDVPYKRVLIVSNLKDNAALLPHYMLQLLLAVGSLPEKSVFISIYESGSSDASGRPPASSIC